MKGAAAGASAKAAYDLLFSEEVQIALLEAAFRCPSRSDIAVDKHADLPAIGSVKVAQKPDFNPIEMAFYKLAPLLRKAAERTVKACGMPSSPSSKSSSQPNDETTSPLQVKMQPDRKML